jgi:predicted ATPase
MTTLAGRQREPARAVAGQVTSDVLVGRREELAWLHEALAHVRGGGQGALLIGGEAGVGKSRLVGDFAAAAAGTGGAGALVLTGSCPDLGPVGLPFAPFSAVLRTLARPPGIDGVAIPPGSELTRLLPELGEAATAGNPREARARLFVEMLSLLERLARQRPVVLVIEDAHWADESSLELLSFLVASQQAMDRVLIIVTYRSDELHRGHPLCSLISSLARLGWVQRQNLSGLSRDESAELVARLAGGPPVPSLAEKVWRRAEGNPLLAEQLVCCDSPRARACPAAGDLMLSAVRQLPAQTQEVLRAASAGGQRTGLGLLAAVTGMDAGALDAALRPAAARGVITAGQGSCTFRHALISEAVHQDLLPGEHTDLHHRFATALQAEPSLVPAGCAATEQAEHWHHVHDPVRALSSAWRAAADAGRALASAGQLAMLTRVLELWPRVPDAGRLTGTGHAEVLRLAAGAADGAGERQLAVALAAAARAGTGAWQVPHRVRAAAEPC